MLIGSRQKLSALDDSIVVSADNVTLSKVRSVKCLEVDIDENLTWEIHIQSIRLNTVKTDRLKQPISKGYNQ
jgi:hypothetical protein